MEVKSFAGGSFTLSQLMPKTISVGDSYSVYAGCRKRFLEDCRDKFNNVVNYRGEPYVPGTDQIMQYGGQT
jgi:uncharacterized phage protein (TIGR02218 family)